MGDMIITIGNNSSHCTLSCPYHLDSASISVPWASLLTGVSLLATTAVPRPLSLVPTNDHLLRLARIELADRSDQGINQPTIIRVLKSVLSTKFIASTPA